MATPIELTEEQKRWVDAIEADFPKMPMGYARAMVELYVKDPEFFSKENIDKMRAMPAPLLERTEGSCEILRGEEAEAFAEQYKSKAGIDTNLQINNIPVNEASPDHGDETQL